MSAAGWVAAVALLGVVAALLRARAVERERLARAAHEVRGPLTALHLALHGVARRGELAPVRLAGLDLELRRAALALDELRAGGPLACTPLDLRELLTAQVATWDEVARAHGGEVVLCDGPGDVVVHADAVRLAQALGNVLANAIEHGGGRVQVRTRWDGGRVVVEVADGGPGLPASVAQLTRRCRGRRAPGRGHGLAVAAAVARRHGGALRGVRGGTVALELPGTAGAAAGGLPADWPHDGPALRVAA